MSRNKILLGLVLALFFIVILFRSCDIIHVQSQKNDKSAEKKILYWVAPMDPNYKRDRPGKSPMGMDLVPVYADDNAEENIIKISPDVENNLGVKTTAVKLMPLSRIISTVGYVTADENSIEHIHTYTDGWIKVLNVKTTGEQVKQGQLLLELFSPTLVNAQEELLLAMKYKNTTLINAGIKKLKTLGLNSNQINELQKNNKVTQNVKIYASQSGIVSRLNVREGMFVKPDTDMMTIEDLSHIWMIAEVFERQSAWVKEGQIALATLPYMPTKSWQGKVDYVYPQLDKKTHTLRVRLSFPNPDLTIKPEMYVNVKILSDTVENALAIPRSSLIRTGDGDRVVIALGEGKYKAIPVKIGIESGDYFDVISGLKQGDLVVTSAQFLIDSESNIKESFNRMQHEDNSQDEMNNINNEFFGMGKIQFIDKVKREILLDHQPIPLLNMPAMSMTLPVSSDVNLSEVETGQEVDFMLKRQHDGTYLVTKINLSSEKLHSPAEVKGSTQ